MTSPPIAGRCVAYFERFTDVLLSRLPRYYEAKFCLIVWLMFWQGADKLYRVVRKGLKKCSRTLPWLFPSKRQISEAEYVETLPWAMREAAQREGLEGLLGSLRCDHDVTTRFGPSVIIELWSMWNKVDPRYLALDLLGARGIPAMDDTGTTDAYAIAYLVPPAGEGEGEGEGAGEGEGEG